jgi:hypothetical protein
LSPADNLEAHLTIAGFSYEEHGANLAALEQALATAGKAEAARLVARHAELHRLHGHQFGLLAERLRKESR